MRTRRWPEDPERDDEQRQTIYTQAGEAAYRLRSMPDKLNGAATFRYVIATGRQGTQRGTTHQPRGSSSADLLLDCSADIRDRQI